MSQINVSHLTFAYDGSFDNVFEDVSFVLDTRWRLGLTGRNGRGKTTLLHLLDGALDSRGAVRKSADCLYFPFSVRDSGRETQAVLQALAPQAELWQLQRELSVLKVDEAVLHRPLCTLSSGEQTKALLAALFLHPEAYLLIDEPTNHLDAEGRRLVSRYLAQKDGFLLVSHDRDFLDGCVDHMLVLGRQSITVMQGNFTVWEREKQRRDDAERARNSQLLREAARLDEAARRTARWSEKAEQEKHARSSGLRPDRGYLGHKAAKLMKRAKTTEARRESAAEERRGLLRDVDEAEALKISPLPWGKSGPLAQARDAALFYGETCVCRASFTLEPGMRLAVTGPNGSGKSTLLNALCTGKSARTGTLAAASGLVVSHVPQDASFLAGAPRAFARRAGADETLFFTLLRKFGFDRVQFEKDMAAFSAGQKKKVLLAASLAQRAHLYVWDEPLNYVDILSRIQIEQLLRTARPTMLFVEHDAAFVRHVATGQIALAGR